MKRDTLGFVWMIFNQLFFLSKGTFIEETYYQLTKLFYYIFMFCFSYEGYGLHMTNLSITSPQILITRNAKCLRSSKVLISKITFFALCNN